MSLDNPLWPAVREALREDLSRIHGLDLHCLSCLYPMVPAGADLKPGRDPDSICRGIFVLPCGHMIGHKCWTKHKENNLQHHCIRCNASFWHSDPVCNHPLEPFDFTDTDDLRKAPLCLQEEGSKIPEQCLSCLFTKEARIMLTFVNASVTMDVFPEVDEWYNIVGLYIASDWGTINFHPDALGQNLTSLPVKVLDTFALDEYVLQPPQLMEDRLCPAVWAPKAAHMCLGVRDGGALGTMLLQLIERELRLNFSKIRIVEA